MTKTILITGSTDGIGLAAAKKLAGEGHTILLHGRSEEKLAAAAEAVGGNTASFRADLSRRAEVDAFADAIAAGYTSLDVLINNAGVYKVPEPMTADGLDVRFMVNTVAPYLLTRRLLPLIPRDGRIVNLSSAAQAPVDIAALEGRRRVSDMEAYAQSKLAITMWTRVMADALADGPVVVAINPGSLLASKMVREGFGVAGNDIGIGADILARAAVADEFAEASGRYFDNDAGQFGRPHPDALNAAKARKVVDAIEQLLAVAT